MKKLYWKLACGLLCLAAFADVRNTDKPLKGEWDFRPQKIWEIDQVDGAPFARPSELRASREGMLYFHDFDRNISYVFDADGKYVNSFARQGVGTGEVDRYLNCFIAGDRVAVGTPGKLQFYSKRGEFIESFENNLFMRFPLLFPDENEFIYSPQSMGPQPAEKITIASFNLRSQQEKIIAEFPVPSAGKPGLPVVVLGLTPQVKMDMDPKTGRLYFGISDEYAIHVCDLKGAGLFSFGIDRKRKIAGADDKRRHFEKSGIPKDRYEKILPALPGELTQFMQVQAAGDLILVYATESLERQQEKIPVDIFSSQGRYLYRSCLRFGGKAPLYTHVEKVVVIENHCFALLKDGSDRSFLAKYRISLPPVH